MTSRNINQPHEREVQPMQQVYFLAAAGKKFARKTRRCECDKQPPRLLISAGSEIDSVRSGVLGNLAVSICW